MEANWVLCVCPSLTFTVKVSSVLQCLLGDRNLSWEGVRPKFALKHLSKGTGPNLWTHENKYKTMDKWSKVLNAIFSTILLNPYNIKVRSWTDKFPITNQYLKIFRSSNLVCPTFKFSYTVSHILNFWLKNLEKRWLEIDSNCFFTRLSVGNDSLCDSNQRLTVQPKLDIQSWHTQKHTEK